MGELRAARLGQADLEMTMTDDNSLRETIAHAVDQIAKRSRKSARSRTTPLRRLGNLQLDTGKDKAVRERQVLREFVSRSGLSILPVSIRSKKPPFPDIVCRHRAEGLIAFELMEICAEDIARSVTHLRKKGGLVYIRSIDPSIRLARNKTRKKYQSRHPIELLCYTAGRTISPDSQIIENLNAVLETDHGPFRKVWLLADKGHLIWSNARSSD